MVKTILGAGALALLLGVPAAQAMPVGDVADAGASVILVSGGCGPYGHRDFNGFCRPGGQWGAGGVPRAYGPGRACPPGYHLGPYRHACWPNL